MSPFGQAQNDRFRLQRSPFRCQAAPASSAKSATDCAFQLSTATRRRLVRSNVLESRIARPFESCANLHASCRKRRCLYGLGLCSTVDVSTDPCLSQICLRNGSAALQVARSVVIARLKHVAQWVFRSSRPKALEIAVQQVDLRAVSEVDRRGLDAQVSRPLCVCTRRIGGKLPTINCLKCSEDDRVPPLNRFADLSEIATVV